MKIVAKPIKTMVVFEYEGRMPIPYKFKLQRDDGSEQLIKIDKRIDSYWQKIAGIEKRYKLKYILSDCRWQLYAI